MSYYKSIIKSSVLASLFLGSSLFASNEIIEANGLDHIKQIIVEDERLNKRLDSDSISKAFESIDKMNVLIKEAIKEQALVNDGELSISDVRQINIYLSSYHLSEWYDLISSSITCANQVPTSLIGIPFCPVDFESLFLL